MNANKLFSEFSLNKIWDKLLQHDKAMRSTFLILSSGSWIEQEDGTFKNTVSYSTFKETDKLTVDLYDDGTLIDTILTEYEQYVDSFEIINGGLVAIANTRPTQTFTLLIKGDFETIADIGNLQDLSDQVSELSGKVEDCFQSVSNGKALLASAITDMEVETDATATFETMAANIRNIETGVDTSNATASEAQIAKGYTAWVNGRLVVGTAILVDAVSGYIVLNSSNTAAGEEITSGWAPSGAFSAADNTTITVQSNNLIDLTHINHIDFTYSFGDLSNVGKYGSSYFSCYLLDTSGTKIKAATYNVSSKGIGTFTASIDTTGLTGSYRIGYVLYSYYTKIPHSSWNEYNGSVTSISRISLF